MATQPVYLLLGDSLTLASFLTPAYTTALADPVYTTGDRGSLQRIWDYEDQAVENYIAHTNSHGGGTRIPPAPYNGAGPEFSLIAKLAARHTTDGVVLVKRSSVSATLIAEGTGWVGDPLYSAGRWAKSVSGENWDEFQTDVSAALTAISSTPPTLGEVQAIFVALGTNDMAVAGGGDLFADAIEQFVTDLRASYGGSTTPVVWVSPQLGTDVSIPAEVTKVRAAIAARAAADPYLVAVDIDDLSKATDQIHLSPASTITMGERMDAALDAVQPIEPDPPAEPAAAAELWEYVQSAYDVDGLVTLTNIRDRSATTVNDAAGISAADAVIALWPAYAQNDFDATDALHLEVGAVGLISVLWRRGGASSAIEEVKWDQVWGPDGMIQKVRRTDARGRAGPKSNSGTITSTESGTQYGWSDRKNLPAGYMPSGYDTGQD